MSPLQRTSRALVEAHPWLTEENASQLLVHAYLRFQDEDRYGGNKTAIHMQITFGVLLRCPEEELRNRLAIAQEWVG